MAQQDVVNEVSKKLLKSKEFYNNFPFLRPRLNKMYKKNLLN